MTRNPPGQRAGLTSIFSGPARTLLRSAPRLRSILSLKFAEVTQASLSLRGLTKEGRGNPPTGQAGLGWCFAFSARLRSLSCLRRRLAWARSPSKGRLRLPAYRQAGSQGQLGSFFGDTTLAIL